MQELYGYVGKILDVDLSSGKISYLPTADYVPKYIGGKGLLLKFYWDLIGPEVKALSAENVVMFMTGPFGGTAAAPAHRTFVAAKAPMMYPQNSFMKSSFGGHWGPELKFAGYDGILIRGASSTPVYLLIEDGKVELRDARYLWGLDIEATQQNIWSRHTRKHKVATIGPAGENLVVDSNIITDDSNTAGKGGFAAVMGYKKIKAIVVRGTGSVPVARPKELLDLSYNLQRLATRKDYEHEPPHSYRGSLYGPLAIYGMDLWNEGREGKNVRMGYCGCFGCPIQCGVSFKFLDGSNIGGSHHMCVEMNTEVEEMEQNNEKWGRAQWERLKLQDHLGISQWSMHLDIWPYFSHGIITPADVGINHEVGTREFSRELMYKIAYREGLGDKIADGPGKFLNEHIGTQTSQYIYAMTAATVGKSRLPYNYAAYFYGPIGWTGACVARGRDNDYTWMIANVATDPRVVAPGSAAHAELQNRLSKLLFGSEQGAIDSRERRFGEFTAPMAKYSHDIKNWMESIGICNTLDPLTSSYTEDHIGDPAALRNEFSAVTGFNISSDEEQLEYSDRIYMLERAIMAREGQTKEDEWFYDFIFDNEMYQAMGLSREALRAAIDHYYTLRGIDVATGLPKRSTLVSLGLEDVADGLVNKYGINIPA